MEGLLLKEAAEKYAKLGFYVSPLWPKSKEPIRGFKYDKPSNDPEVIKYLWQRCANANIALPTGRRYNNLIVFDLDVSAGINGCDNLKKLLCTHKIVIPNTMVVKTGSGGYHLYYKNTSNMICPSVKNIIPGIDVLSEGAHVVAPPSIHETGRRYEYFEKNNFQISLEI